MATFLFRLPLRMEQVPLSLVVQLKLLPPELKEPIRTAPATALPVLLITLAVTVARQLFLCESEDPVRPLTRTVVLEAGGLLGLVGSEGKGLVGAELLSL